MAQLLPNFVRTWRPVPNMSLNILSNGVKPRRMTSQVKITLNYWKFGHVSEKLNDFLLKQRHSESILQ